jgi:hypothetical protein
VRRSSTPPTSGWSFGTDILNQLGQWYNQALVGVESNNHGLTTLSALRDVGYRNIYRQHRHLQRFEPKTELLGWRTTFASKALAIDELGREIRDGGVELHDADTLGELRTFVREGNGRMHGSPFDDRTMALAIAVQMLKHAWLPEYRVDQTPGPGTAGFLESKLYGDGFRIGKGGTPMRIKRRRIGAANVGGQSGRHT